MFGPDADQPLDVAAVRARFAATRRSSASRCSAATT
ncbi:Uncharacterised protein [Bordetella pertussis]|nr:Uncharacterised protein [Bordetella pertussis]